MRALEVLSALLAPGPDPAPRRAERLSLTPGPRRRLDVFALARRADAIARERHGKPYGELDEATGRAIAELAMRQARPSAARRAFFGRVLGERAEAPPRRTAVHRAGGIPAPALSRSRARQDRRQRAIAERRG